MLKLEHKGKEYPVWYKHERIVEDGVVLPKGGKTIAFIKLDEKNSIEAYADCSVLDAYNKKIGRKISSGRLEKKIYGKPLFRKMRVLRAEKEKKFREEARENSTEEIAIETSNT